ncbi:MAG TPA: phosphotransferase family protein [Amycolatopsis sp.]|nr:phosphotransferase family protein [Amycolatopsis sp.]
MTTDERAGPMELIDRRALEDLLTRTVEPYSEMTVTLLAGGASNLTYLVRLDDRRYVLRRRPLGPSAPRAHDMHREYTVLAALQGRGLPVPRVHAYHEAADVAGAPCYLMDFVDGVVIHTPQDAEPLQEKAAAQVSHELVRTLAGLHSLDPGDLAIPDFGRPEGFLRRRINSWLRQWGSVEHRDFLDVERIGAALLADLPAQQRSTLVHGDYRLGNVILSLDGDVSVGAILDWEMSTIGDPLTDLAHLLVYWEPTRGRVTHPSQLISRRPGFLDGRSLAAEYASATGCDLSPLSFYLAFEHWRAAIIKDAIYLRRLHAAGEPDDELAEFGRTVGLHLEEAADILDEARASGPVRGVPQDKGGLT